MCFFFYPGCQLCENSTVAFEKRTSPTVLLKHYIFISEDLRRAETLIFLITKVNSISLFMCFVSQSLRSAATVCLCLQTGTFGLSPHAILALLFQEKKYYINFGRNGIYRQTIFFVHAQLYVEGFNVNTRVKISRPCIKKEKKIHVITKRRITLRSAGRILSL